MIKILIILLLFNFMLYSETINTDSTGSKDIVLSELVRNQLEKAKVSSREGSFKNEDAALKSAESEKLKKTSEIRESLKDDWALIKVLSAVSAGAALILYLLIPKYTRSKQKELRQNIKLLRKEKIIVEADKNARKKREKLRSNPYLINNTGQAHIKAKEMNIGTGELYLAAKIMSHRYMNTEKSRESK